jgi:predicted transcriptional regulator
MKPAKAMTVRLSADQAEQLETVASVDNQPVSEVVRAAIAEHIASRTKDSAFPRQRIERGQQMLERDRRPRCA